MMYGASIALFVLSIVTLILLIVLLIFWIIGLVHSQTKTQIRFTGPSACEDTTTKFLQSYFDQTFAYASAGRSYMETSNPSFITQMNQAAYKMDVLFRSLKVVPDPLKSILQQFTTASKSLYESRGRLTDAINESLSQQYLAFFNYAQSHDGSFALNDTAKVFVTVSNAWVQWVLNKLHDGFDNANARQTLVSSLAHFAAHLCSFN